VFAVAFELPAASVPWRGGSSGTLYLERTQKDTDDSTCQYKKLQIQMVLPPQLAQ